MLMKDADYNIIYGSDFIFFHRIVNDHSHLFCIPDFRTPASLGNGSGVIFADAKGLILLVVRVHAHVMSNPDHIVSTFFAMIRKSPATYPI